MAEEFSNNVMDPNGGQSVFTRKEVMEKEIDLIQSCILRMAANTSEIKNWTVVLITVVLALLPEKFNLKVLSLVCLSATVVMWYLASYYLFLERCFRLKYQWVIKNRLNTDDFFFDLNPSRKETWDLYGNNTKAKPKLLRVMFSKSILPIFALLIVLEIVCFFWKSTQ